MKAPSIIAIFLLLVCFYTTKAQLLRPGFDPEEYMEMLRISALQVDTPWKINNVPQPYHHQLVYRSPVTGLDNRWDMWQRTDGKVAVMSIRGTTKDNTSWLENFYCAMIPASGSIQLPGRRFDYHLSDDPRAAIHIGWTIGLGSLAPTIEEQFRIQYDKGVRHFIIMGHSQGGAIAFLLNSYLHDLMKKGKLPGDVTIKTYCSAGPKPGNLYYAYSYEQMTQGGWAYNVINPKDWVPETPFSIQTTRDFSNLNPFNGARSMIRKMPGMQRIVLGYVYGRLDKSTKKASRKFKNTLGDLLSNQVKKLLPGYVQPALANTMDYVRVGNSIILKPDAGYLRLHPDNSANVFVHHMPGPYYDLAAHMVGQ